LFFVGDATNAPAVSIANCTLDGGSGSGTYLNCLVNVQNGSLTLEAGATLQNNGMNQLNGGAVKVSATGVSAVMLQGSSISGCTAGNGGAVYVTGGTFTLEGGTISDCSAINGNGGAVYVVGQNAKAVFNGGTITGCKAIALTAGGSGGAVCVYSTSSVVDFYTDGNVARTVMTGNTATSGSILYKFPSTIVRVNGDDKQFTNFLTETGYNSAAVAWY
jgi:hypothetical protein